MPVGNLNICLLQANLVWENKKENLMTFDRMISELKSPADIILLPEMLQQDFR